MTGVKVVKFGGSSLADANQFKKVADIVKADEARRFVVVSAPGKRYSEDSKITDMLYDCYEKAIAKKDFEKEYSAIKERYNSIIRDLSLDISLDEEFDHIKYSFEHSVGRDYAASRGEYLNAMLLAEYLGFPFLDPVGLLCFDEKGEFDLEKSAPLIGDKLSELGHAVIPGFYGSMPNNTIKTFSRGGSDITGSIIANAVDADIYENWTDVSGFLICDPRIVDNPKPITTITYRELRELSYMGAAVLHEEAIFPVRTKGIPINIKNTNHTEDPGTMIVKQTDKPSQYTITGIAGKKGFLTINIEKDRMNSMIGFGRSVLRVLEKNGIGFEHMPSGIDTLSVIVREESLNGKEETVIEELKSRVKPDHIKIENDLAIIAVVGRGMRQTRGTAGRIFSALAHARINVRMIDQGSSELNIIIGISESDYEKAIRVIYDMFVLTEEPNLLPLT